MKRLLDNDEYNKFNNVLLDLDVIINDLLVIIGIIYKKKKYYWVC